MSAPNNPPAFPLSVNQLADSSPEAQGMSLRDWFAGQAMKGLLAGVVHASEKIAESEGGSAEEVIARWAFEQADAMLAEREKSA